MKIIELSKQDIELFGDMDPLQMSDRLDFPDTFAYAALLEGEKGDDVPVGLMICRDNGKSIIVEWLCVSVSHRRKGIGEALLHEAFHTAINKSYTRVQAYLTNEYGRELVCVNEEQYLRERFFLETRELSGEWRLYIHDFIHQKPQKLADKKRIRVRPLRELPSTERREVLDQIASMQYVSSLYPIIGQMHLLEQDLSNILYIDGKPAGGLLIQAVTRKNIYMKGENLIKKEETVLYPVFMCIGSAEGLRQLLYEVISIAMEKYPTDTEVRVIMRKGLYAPLLEKMFSGRRIDNRMLSAQIEDYQEQRIEPEYLLSLGW